MTALKVPDMHCVKCVERISSALRAKGMEFSISLADKTVSVGESDISAAIEVLDDIGFEAQQ